MRARVLVGVEVIDQQSMDTASEKLIEKGYPALKARIATDLSATGVNRAAYCPPFRYPGPSDGLAIVRRGCWLAKGDVSRYFFEFPIAKEAYSLFLIVYLSVWYVFVRCCFGFSPCPYYCSTWSVEFRTWALSEGIPCSHMVDDWITRRDTKAEAMANIRRISKILEIAGFTMGLDKEEVGQRIVFLGLLIDTVRMRVSIDSTQAKGFCIQLQQYLEMLEGDMDVDEGTVRHVCGKLNWYCEVVQSGRVHTRMWWAYNKHGSHLREREALKDETRWWVRLTA